MLLVHRGLWLLPSLWRQWKQHHLPKELQTFPLGQPWECQQWQIQFHDVSLCSIVNKTWSLSLYTPAAWKNLKLPVMVRRSGLPSCVFHLKLWCHTSITLFCKGCTSLSSPSQCYWFQCVKYSQEQNLGPRDFNLGKGGRVWEGQEPWPEWEGVTGNLSQWGRGRGEITLCFVFIAVDTSRTQSLVGSPLKDSVKASWFPGVDCFYPQ